MYFLLLLGLKDIPTFFFSTKPIVESSTMFLLLFIFNHYCVFVASSEIDYGKRVQMV